MTPVAFNNCLGWLHEGRGSTGIVLCGSFGQEGMTTYRGWVRLATRLSASGFHVLRFDYPGTGDSLDGEADTSRFDHWVDSIGAAVEFLRTSTGAEKTVLVGLRLGGALALLAGAKRPDVTAVACLMPVVSGKAYLRELRLLTNAWRDANLLPPAPVRAGYFDVVGDEIAEATRQDLARLNLLTITTAPSQILLMEDDAYPRTSELAKTLEQLGCHVTRLPFIGAAEYLHDSLASNTPEESFADLGRWCAAFRSGELSSVTARSASPPVLKEPSLYDERPYRFGPSKELVGILCTPATTKVQPSVVIMVNTGLGRRIGDGRVFVTLARRLASEGMASLRMDMAGFGDSAGDASPDPYSIDRVSDVVAAIEALDQQGMRNPLLIGICSGAHAAFHASLADRRVSGLVTVNLQKFSWTAGTSLKVENRQQRRPLGFYVKAIVAPKAWDRLLNGQVAPFALIATLVSRLFANAYRELCLVLETATGIKSSAGATMRDVKDLASRGTQIKLVYSEGDPGLSELSKQFGPGLRRLRAISGTELRIIDAADHALLDQAARSRFIELVASQFDRKGPTHPEPALAHNGRSRLHAVSIAS